MYLLCAQRKPETPNTFKFLKIGGPQETEGYIGMIIGLGGCSLGFL